MAVSKVNNTWRALVAAMACQLYETYRELAAEHERECPGEGPLELELDSAAGIVESQDLTSEIAVAMMELHNSRLNK